MNSEVFKKVEKDVDMHWATLEQVLPRWISWASNLDLEKSQSDTIALHESNQQNRLMLELGASVAYEIAQQIN